jgi:hypothetical protein
MRKIFRELATCSATDRLPDEEVTGFSMLNLASLTAEA